MLNVKKIINDSNIAFGTSGARGLVIDFSMMFVLRSLMRFFLLLMTNTILIKLP
ncbi:Uncharacterised protein [Escherichia coli]|uniref:Uncharacterized protein n=1 Tax=Escherichia coli TaxID=562 RepID=A0A377D5I8_ECOLX|nr:Uncharacterised protein [Escherichia coli]